MLEWVSWYNSIIEVVDGLLSAEIIRLTPSMVWLCYFHFCIGYHCMCIWLKYSEKYVLLTNLINIIMPRFLTPHPPAPIIRLHSLTWWNVINRFETFTYFLQLLIILHIKALCDLFHKNFYYLHWQKQYLDLSFSSNLSQLWTPFKGSSF